MTHAIAVRQQRPPTVVVSIVLLTTLGLGAIGGGWAMLFGVNGEPIFPESYLTAIPLLDSWLIPGLVLLVGFGLGSLTTAYGVAVMPKWPTKWLQWGGHHWSWAATILIGAGQMTWIGLEFAFIPVSWLMPTFGLLGLALTVLSFTPSMRRHLQLG